MATRGSAQQVFQVQNTGEVAVNFVWHLEAPFSIQPASGRLKAKEIATFEASFDPEDASVCSATAAIEADNGFQSYMRVCKGQQGFMNLGQLNN